MLLDKNISMQIITVFISIIIFFKVCFADIGKETGLEIPRYISIKSDQANIRVGPSKNYPIVIKYIKKNFPLKVVDEYNEWRKVEDVQNNVGWIHKSLISGKRTGLIISLKEKNVEVYNSVYGNAIGKIGTQNIVFIEKCKINWCSITFNNYSGWINKKNIWGVKNKESFNINFLQKFEDLYWQSFNYLVSNK